MYKETMYKGPITYLRYNLYTIRFCTIEVGGRGLISKSAHDALKQLGLKWTMRNRTVRSQSEAAEKSVMLAVVQP